MTLQWEPHPVNKECVHYYRVCHHLLPESFSSAKGMPWKSDEICTYTDEVLDYTATLEHLVEDLEPCGKYRFEVTAVTADERLESPTVFHEDQVTLDGKFEIKTIDYIFHNLTSILLIFISVPGEPTSFVVFATEPYSITVVWNRPNVNPLCVKESVHLDQKFTGH